jgi:hypothetical protein
MGVTMRDAVGKIDMCFLIAALVLGIALFTGALIAPQPGSRPGLRVDPCALETGDWSMIDFNCGIYR